MITLDSDRRLLLLEQKVVDAKIAVLAKEHQLTLLLKKHKQELKNMNISIGMLKKSSRRAVCNLADYKYKQTPKGLENRKRWNKSKREQRAKMRILVKC